MESPTCLNSWKGKAKAIEQDFDDLDPTITYRHLHAQNLGVKDPLRVIALCDSDAFYAACEMVRLGTSKDTPLVVLQWNILIAVNYPARKYGISRLVKFKGLDELRSKCPDLVIVHVATLKEGDKEPRYWDEIDSNTHKVSLDYYRRESVKIAQLFKECLPGVEIGEPEDEIFPALLLSPEIEKASIDEAFFDFTKPVREILLERHPYLAQVPEEGLDTPLPPPPPIFWDDLGNVIPINPDDVTGDEAIAGAEAHRDPDGASATWHDVALSIGAELMDKARKEVYTKLGYSTSAGIARNKFLAKLTASYKKPMNQSILRNAAIPEYLTPIPFQKIRFLGGKLGSALAEEFGASTVSDMLTISLDEMRRKLGDDCLWIYEILRGIDRSEVKDKKVIVKSMLAAKNLTKPITNASEGYHWIRMLAAELALRLNDARKSIPNLWPKTLVLLARKGYDTGRSKQAPFLFAREVTIDIVAAAADKLWKELVGTNVAMKVTYIHLGFTGLESSEAGQRSIEGFLTAGQAPKRPRSEDDTQFESLDDDITGVDLNGESDLAIGHTPSFTCTRCGKTLSLAVPLLGVGTEETLVALRQEHDDFHFAQDLAKQQPSDGPVISGPSKLGPSRISPKKKKRRKDPPSRGGIEQFFGRNAS